MEAQPSCLPSAAAYSDRLSRFLLLLLLLLIARGNPNAEPNYLAAGIVTPPLRQFAAAVRQKIALGSGQVARRLLGAQRAHISRGRARAARDANS